MTAAPAGRPRRWAGCDLDTLGDGELGKFPDLAVVADLRELGTVAALRRCLGRPGPNTGLRAFVISAGAARHADEVQARALGATAFLGRETCLRDLRRLMSVANEAPLAPARAALLRQAPGGEAIASTGNLLSRLFGGFNGNGPVPLEAVERVEREIGASISAVGAEAWLDTVRDYHEGTFQHCLLVTGTAAGFAARHIASREMAAKLTTAALFHDVGKAAVPVHILDKPGRLTEDEFAAVRVHPAAGADYLKRQGNLDEQVLDAIRHHHEALDGSGYPDGLAGERVSPLTRILTVCDIFAALVESRPYKPPKAPDEAITILVAKALDTKVEYRVVRSLAEVFDITLPATIEEVRDNLARLGRPP